MSSVLRAPMEIDAFLAWEAGQALRHEFDGFAPVAMTGATYAHGLIQSNLLRAVGTRLRGGACRVVGSDLKLRVAGSVRYPDAMVLCTPPDPGATLVTEPVVVFEILSPATAFIDRIVKNREYRATPSIRRYVLLEQDRPAATVFAREGADWLGRLVDADAALDLPELGVTVPMGEIYEDVAFPDQAG